MNVGKTLFAQVMEFVPWKTFARIIDRHKGDAGVRTLGCADLFRILAFSQLTWRESLLDIEVCLEANQAKQPVSHGDCRAASPLHAGRCVEPTRLAHLPAHGFVPCLAAAKVTGYVWHSNRHTFCSWLAMAGATINEIQELAGHKTITMSARYAHLSPDHKLSAIDRIAATATETATRQT